MPLVICSIRDSKSETFGRPFFVPTVGVAVRSFDDEVNRPADDNMLYNHEKDFALYLLGEWNESTAEFTLEKQPKILIQGDQVKKHPLGV